jgi:hypothetical protein
MAMRRFTRKRLAIIVSVAILVGAICLEAFAHFYIQIYNLPVVASEEALKVPSLNNGTRTFSSNGAQWLIITQLPAFDYLVNPGIVGFYIYKIQENTSLFVQSLNLVAEKIDIQSNPDGVRVDPAYGGLRFDTYSRTEQASVLCTIAGQGYIISQSGTYEVDFAFTFRIYETTLLGIFQVNEATVHFNATWTL